MYTVEIRSWDYQTKQYYWEPVKVQNSKKPMTFPSEKTAAEFAIYRYSRILPPDHVRVVAA